ncbi:MAG: ABC transporter ATP-binding protein [Actinomycetia bacterium]|nr:ABC transporter ATP-binding protein [Actinomycetes bacterium]
MTENLAAGAPCGAAPATASPEAHAAVDLAGLVKSYGPVRAVDGVDLRIARGEVVALLGPNGSGKSTTIDMMLGLATPGSGTARLFGLAPADAIRSGRVGAMLQTGELLPHVTVGEIVELIASLHERALTVDRALEQAGIAELAARRTEKLSGGQTQRVRFAMALVADPDLLVLDEPTAGMDVQSRAAFWAAMRDQARAGRTIVFATHYLEEADAYADRIVLLAAGRVVADGPVTEITSTAVDHTIRATLRGADTARLAALPGVRTAEARGDTVALVCSDSDLALRALLAAEPAARHVEVSRTSLTEAFLTLTGGDPR